MMQEFYFNFEKLPEGKLLEENMLLLCVVSQDYFFSREPLTADA